MTPPVPLTAAELADYRYRDIAAVVAAQNDAIAAFSRYLGEWQANLSDVSDKLDRALERLDRLERVIESWDTPLPAEDRLDEAAADALAAREEVCRLTDLIVYALRRSGVEVPRDATLTETWDFVAKSTGPHGSVSTPS